MSHPANRRAPTPRQKKLIHWGANALGYDRDAYEGLLYGVTGKTSTLEMTAAEAKEVISEIERRFAQRGEKPPWRRPPAIKGRRPNPGFRFSPRWLRVRPATCTATQHQLTIIRDRWQTLGRLGYYDPDKAQAALDAFLARRFGVGSIHDLDSAAARGVVKALIEMTER